MNIFTSCAEFRIRTFIGQRYVETTFADIKTLSEKINYVDENRFNFHSRFKGTLIVKIDRFTGFLDIKKKKIFENDKVTFKWKTNEHGDIETITDYVRWDKVSGGFIFGKDDMFTFNEVSAVQVLGEGNENLLADDPVLAVPKGPRKPQRN